MCHSPLKSSFLFTKKWLIEFSLWWFTTVIITLGLDGISWEVLPTLPARAVMLAVSPRSHCRVGVKSWRLQWIWKCTYIIIFITVIRIIQTFIFFPSLAYVFLKKISFFFFWNAIFVIDLQLTRKFYSLRCSVWCSTHNFLHTRVQWITEPGSVRNFWWHRW